MFTTHPKLLIELKRGDNVSWYQFRDMYRPLIFHCAEQVGVPASDFLELEVDVLSKFYKACETFEYDPAKGKFRSYFGTLVRNCIAELRRKRQQDNRMTNLDMVNLGEDAFEKCWEEEWKQHMFWLAMTKARMELPKKMIETFELCDIRGMAPCDAAAAMDVSLATVYNYRRKALATLRRYVKGLRESEENTR